MSSGRKLLSAASLLFAVLLVAALAPRPAAGQGEAASRIGEPPVKASCVFTHPAFSGKCTQNVDVPATSTVVETCSTILDCLNDVRCTKTYCSATTLRGGWKLESTSPAATP